MTEAWGENLIKDFQYEIHDIKAIYLHHNNDNSNTDTNTEIEVQSLFAPIIDGNSVAENKLISSTGSIKIKGYYSSYEGKYTAPSTN